MRGDRMEGHWWGEGETEWKNIVRNFAEWWVVRQRSLKHHQPFPTRS